MDGRLEFENPTAETAAERLLRGAWVAGRLPCSNCQFLECISADHLAHLAGRLDENCDGPSVRTQPLQHPHLQGASRVKGARILEKQ